MKPALIWLITLLLLTSTACASRSQQAAPEFTSFDAFVQALETVAGNGKREVDAFWDALVDSKQVPFILGDQVAFLYRGRARSVQWIGDFTDWQRGPPLEGQRVGKSTLWVAYATFPTNARLEYRVVVNEREAIPS